jgi:multidrug transporter EmrE-like cation transporter
VNAQALAGAFATGVVQVFLVAFQTRQVANRAPVRNIVLVALGISAVWVFNVRAAVSGLPAGVAYTLGAGLGTYLAMKMRMKGER